uniref:ATP synthase subunit a n=1 Tax=Anthonomus rubi TaxID=201759 RepID=A0A5B8ZUQ0_9CUCU|nr:ATP synthase subunit 6 [Anthonomus rubi]QED56366.1 ATP synthase subunit 6 [Anthonomus rubi]QED56379.1 ATP synthase subunit 6 [Anthonomus rubi]QED56391.1 ATP synthase subunit 6 [Anthonomus rubi]QEH58489.1 ATP synthase subunit 6 [Anthonomus rubi]
MNLFSIFEPSTIIFSLNWMSSLLMILIIPPMYWLIPSRISMMWILMYQLLHKEFKVLIKAPIFKGSTIFFTSLFTFILLNNFLSLFPYIFASSSHLSFTLTLSFPLWLSFMIFGWFKNTTHMFAHLTPQNAPAILLPFLVIIETISSIIRPGTLAIRLTANMIAGHLLVTLMGNSGSSLSISLLTMLVFMQILLLILESAVSIIQSYVFSILSALYSKEVI